MSLILDALRKSEAERRRGQSPDLYAELPPSSRDRARAAPPWRWLALALLAVAIVGWAARGLWRDAPPPTGDADSTAVATPRPVRPIPIAATAAPVRAATDAPPPVATLTRPLSAPSPAPSPAPPATATPAVTAPAPAMPPARSAPPVAITPADGVANAGPLAPPITPPPASRAPTPPSAPPATAAASPAPAPATIAHAGTLLRLADLSVAEREQLPPLKMSMHMWGQNPTQRFAIIDGSRVGEGDRVGNAVVDEIDADGVVLSWNGVRVKLPVR